MIIDLMRHGATGRAGYMDGTTDSPLSENGLAEFEGATHGKTWGLVVTSQLQRARVAGERIGKVQALDVEVDPRWAEMDFGTWDGQSRTAIETEPAGRDALAAFFKDPGRCSAPGGEPWSALTGRVRDALTAIVRRDLKSPTLIVTHAGPMRVALAEACGLPFDRLWAFRIGYATRVRLQVGLAADDRLWGEIIEMRQP